MARKHDLISYANGKEIPDVARVDTPKWGELPKDLVPVPPSHAEPPKNKNPFSGWVPQYPGVLVVQPVTGTGQSAVTVLTLFGKDRPPEVQVTTA